MCLTGSISLVDVVKGREQPSNVLHRRGGYKVRKGAMQVDIDCMGATKCVDKMN